MHFICSKVAEADTQICVVPCFEQASAPEVLESGEEGLRRRSGEDADVQALQLLLLHASQRHGPHIVRPAASIHPSRNSSWHFGISGTSCSALWE